MNEMNRKLEMRKEERKKPFRIEDTNEKNLPLVSVIMPVYNAQKYLANTLKSLFTQKYKKIEVICINDGSDDESLQILREIAYHEERLKIIDQENEGPASARNAGLDLASGKYISFIDADDMIDEWMHYSLVEYAEDQEADIIVFGGTPYPNTEHAPKWIWDKLSPRFKVYDYVGAGKVSLFQENSSVPFLWLHFIRREIIERAPKLRFRVDMDLGEDQLFQFMYFPRAEKIIYWDKRYYFYRWLNEGSIMWNYNHKRVTKFYKHLYITENVVAEWKKARYVDVYGDLVSWMVDFLYVDLMTFPDYLKYEFSKKIMDIIEKYQMNVWCSLNAEKVKEIEQLSKEKITLDDCIRRDITTRQELVDQMEHEIEERLKSRAFKLGVKLTPKRKRIDISDVLPPLKKKN